MTQTVWILGDQLLEQHPALEAAVAAHGRDGVCVLMIESHGRAQRLPYQRKRLVLLFSAMRHYAAQLRAAGFDVDYRMVGRFGDALHAHLAERTPVALWTMAASSWNGRGFQARLAPTLDLPVHLLPNTQFLIGHYNPIPQPEPDRAYVMEHFYRAMRRHFDVLMDGDEPVAGQWNFDRDNRRPLPPAVDPPPDLAYEPDALTRQVIADVAALKAGVGSVDGFGYAVTRAQALALFEAFLAQRLADFGPYEDAMTARSHSLFHSVLSPYLNLGLLEPLELVRGVEDAYRHGRVPINSAEGFIRQVLGWREFMAWQYWRQMPQLLHKNAWDATRRLPDWFWTGDTPMACLRHAITRALSTGYNHHIERLMLLSNFLMLVGVDPAVANDWFTALYIDAADWVMPPNVMGMGLNADGGLTATKPYIASANYINKMGDHCSGCRYSPRQRTGDDACPFNFLYWNFLLEHEARLRANPRLGRNVLGLRHLDGAERTAVRAQAAAFLENLA